VIVPRYCLAGLQRARLKYKKLLETENIAIPYHFIDTALAYLRSKQLNLLD
jgi:hypothetical protein